MSISQNVAARREDFFASRYLPAHYVFLGVVLILAVILRFWGLDNVGLHGDEETMAMPVMSILDNGLPQLPSGFLYSRAPGQLYLMAGSVAVFGQSEWALRLPSALVGTIGVIVAFFLGRRFLDPRWNLLFVLVIALLPALIDTSKTARMYIFLSTFTMLFAVAVFRWERQKTWVSLGAAVVILLVAVQFHRLAIFCAPLLFFPLLTVPDKRVYLQASIGFVATLMVFLGFDAFVEWQYGGVFADVAVRLEAGAVDVSKLARGEATLPLVLAMSAPASLLFTQGRWNWLRVAAAVLFVAAMIAVAFNRGHLGLLAGLLAGIAYLRAGGGRRVLGWATLAIAIVFVVQALLLVQSGAPLDRKLVGVLLGSPSVWPYFRFGEYFPVALMVYGVLLIAFMKRFTQGGPLPDHLGFFLVAVWLQLFLLGWFRWDIAPRYAFACIPFFVLALLAAVRQYVPQSEDWRRWGMPAVAVLVLLALIRPMELRGSINPDYGKYPDHKGAAEYLKSVGWSNGDILVAEDVLQQTYYLGKVDHWLLGIDTARKFVSERQGGLRDVYTGTLLLGTGQELEDLLRRHRSGAVYIIGSGENWAQGRRVLRTNGIAEVLDELEQRIVYRGRDGRTVIWRIDPMDAFEGKGSEPTAKSDAS